MIPKHQPDIVLMDVQLPNMSGIELLRAAKPRCGPLRDRQKNVFDRDADLVSSAAFVPLGADVPAAPTGETELLARVQALTRRGQGAQEPTELTFADSTAAVAATPGVETLARCATGAGPGQAAPVVFMVSIKDFLASPALQHEMFGPATLIVQGKLEEIEAAIPKLEGQLTASLHGTDAELLSSGSLVAALQSRAGRLIFNGYPTGVEVCNSIVHGGPFPATSDGRSTSVGTMAIFRFCRPVAWQSFPDAVLPPELQDANPLGKVRLGEQFARAQQVGRAAENPRIVKRAASDADAARQGSREQHKRTQRGHKRLEAHRRGSSGAHG